MAPALMSVEETGRALGVSRSTVWRLIQRGELPTVRRGGRRMVQASALRRRIAPTSSTGEIPPFSEPTRSFAWLVPDVCGGRPPGARDKHALLDE